MADKYPGLTPYLYCNGNPIMLIDPDGMAPSDDEAAAMAAYAYGDAEGDVLDGIKKQIGSFIE